MKNILKGSLLLVLSLSLSLISASCKKEKTGIDGLPPATQTGEQTFGCLVNGVLFKPKGVSIDGGPVLQSNYQFVNGDYIYIVSATQKINNSLFAIDINVLGILMRGGTPLTTGEKGVGIAAYTVYRSGVINEYRTNSINKGELKITRFDDVNQIVSGTFWFDAVNDKGEKVEVREGRFDMRFTK